MKIVYIKLVNFVGVHAAMGLNEIDFKFDHFQKSIIQIYGKNRCGKTVLIQQLHPFSSINLNGDERSDLGLIIPHETGIKQIVYEMNGDTYVITHTYKPTPSGNHTIISSITKDGEELNQSGGVNTFNTLIENIFGINKYTFQFIINGTQLTSFANMSNTQRKNLLNKAMGIDVYDKIHKLATEDYRYTSKLITSLNNTKEFILSQYGSYENLCIFLNKKQELYDTTEMNMNNAKSNIDRLQGEIDVLESQNIQHELDECSRTISIYESIENDIGKVDKSSYDILVNQQIELNSQISELKNKRLLLLKDIDVLSAKKNDIESTLMNNRRIRNDYDNLLRIKDNIEKEIKSIIIEEKIESTSEYILGMISLGQTINSICQEIIITLNHEHLLLFAKMIDRGIDISAFLMQEGVSLMDSEKEKSVISRIRSMINSVDGEYINCDNMNKCVYRKTHETLMNYFKSFESTSEHEFTQYDMEQFDHANKNIQTIKRLLNGRELTSDVEELFVLRNIINNIANNNVGVNIDRLNHLLEVSGLMERRVNLITNLSDTESKINMIKDSVINTNDTDDAINELNKNIESINIEINNINNDINVLTNSLNVNDNQRMKLSQIQHIDINSTRNKYNKFSEMKNNYNIAMNSISEQKQIYFTLQNSLNTIGNELKILKDASVQYNNTVAEIEKYLSQDSVHKIIAEATSSTKGKPVHAIRDEMNNALVLTNRLLEVMYDGEIEMMKPEIDETSFSLPFRCGTNISRDIRYGSQSESTLLSLALSLSLASSLTPYSIGLCDELDAYLDTNFRDSFILMMQEIMNTLNLEQLFLISHSILPGQYDHIVDVLDISKEIESR